MDLTIKPKVPPLPDFCSAFQYPSSQYRRSRILSFSVAEIKNGPRATIQSALYVLAFLSAFTCLFLCITASVGHKCPRRGILWKKNILLDILSAIKCALGENYTEEMMENLKCRCMNISHKINVVAVNITRPRLYDLDLEEHTSFNIFRPFGRSSRTWLLKMIKFIRRYCESKN